MGVPVRVQLAGTSEFGEKKDVIWENIIDFDFLSAMNPGFRLVVDKDGVKLPFRVTQVVTEMTGRGIEMVLYVVPVDKDKAKLLVG